MPNIGRHKLWGTGAYWGNVNNLKYITKDWVLGVYTTSTTTNIYGDTKTIKSYIYGIQLLGKLYNPSIIEKKN